MNIDKKVLNRYYWYEDGEGNILDLGNRVITEEEKEVYYIHRTCFPCRLTESTKIYDYDYSRLSPIKQMLIRIPFFKKIIQKKLTKTYMPAIEFHTTFNDDVIMAMVNSGDYTLGEAIVLWCTSCERCMNVLAHKYLNGTDGYEEYSEEWKRCNTVCDFCRNM